MFRNLLFILAICFPFFQVACTKKIQQPETTLNQQITTKPSAPVADTIPFTLALATEYKIEYKNLVTKSTQVGAQFFTNARIFGERGVEDKSSKIKPGIVELQTSLLDTFLVKKNAPGVCIETGEMTLADSSKVKYLDIDFGNGIVLTYGPGSDESGTYILYAGGGSGREVSIAGKKYNITSGGPYELMFLTKEITTGGTGKEAPGKKASRQ